MAAASAAPSLLSGRPLARRAARIRSSIFLRPTYGSAVGERIHVQFCGRIAEGSSSSSSSIKSRISISSISSHKSISSHRSISSRSSISSRTRRVEREPVCRASLGRVQDDALLDDLAEAVLGAAEEIAFEAGFLIREKLGRAREVTSKEERCDLVTEVDRECEQLIRERVEATFPLHKIVGEETFNNEQLSLLREGGVGPQEWAWVVDPIDGTLNFVAGIPMCTVSLGIVRGGEVEVGVVYNPFSNELFSARKGEGAYYQGKPIARDLASEGGVLELEDAAVAVGFPSNAAERARMIAAIGAVAPHARTIRAFGSAALHMSYVAAGKLGAFFEYNLKPWDIAAARLIVQEAGGTVTSMDGSELPLAGGSVLVSRGGGALHQRLLSLIGSSGAKDTDRQQ